MKKYILIAHKSILFGFRCFIVPLILFVSIFIGGIYAFCYWKSDYVLKNIEILLQEETGIHWKITGSIKPLFFPTRIAISDIHMHLPSSFNENKEGINLYLPHLTLSVDLPWISSEKRWISHIDIDKVALELQLSDVFSSSQGSEQTDSFLDFLESFPGILSTKFLKEGSVRKDVELKNYTSVDFALEQDHIAVYTKKIEAILQTATKKLHSIVTDSFMHSIPSVALHEATVALCDEEKRELAYVHLFSFHLDTAHDHLSLQGSGIFEIAKESIFSSFAFNNTLYIPLTKIEGELNANISWGAFGENGLHAHIHTPFEWDTTSFDVKFPQFFWSLEDNMLSGSLVLKPEHLSLSGDVTLTGVSLPRWFKFARNLPPSLQILLNNINGTVTLDLSPYGFYTRNMFLYAGKSIVTGDLGAPFLGEPVVTGNLLLNDANLDVLFPFLAIDEYDNSLSYLEPHFSHPYLVPYEQNEVSTTASATTKDEDESSFEVGYDIFILAKRGTVHSLKTGPFQVHVFPKKDDSTRVAFLSNNIAEGKLSGYIDVGENLVTMHYASRAMQSSYLPENNGSPVQISGLLDSDFDIHIDVNSLDGSWDPVWRFSSQARIEDFQLDSLDRSWQLKADKVQLNHTGTLQSLRNKGISLMGIWNGEFSHLSSSWAKNAKDNISIILDGTINWLPVPEGEVSQSTAKGLEKVKGAIQLQGSMTPRLGNFLLPVPGELSGNLDWNIHTDTFFLDRFAYRGFGSEATGSISINYGQEFILSGQILADLAVRNIFYEWDLLSNLLPILPERSRVESTINLDSTGIHLDPFLLSFETGEEMRGRISIKEKRSDWKKVSLIAPKKRITPIEIMQGLDTNPTLQKNLVLAQQASTNDIQDKNQQTLSSSTKHEEKKGIARKNKKFLYRAGRSDRSTGDSFWTVNINGNFVDLDDFMDSSSDKLAKEADPFELDFLQGIHADIRVYLDELLFNNLSFKDNTIDFTLDKQNLALEWLSKNVYGGTSSFNVSGRVVFPHQLSLRQIIFEANDFSLQNSLFDLFDSDDYSGTASVHLLAYGDLYSTDDIPRKLSGRYFLEALNGSYPAFVGSETLGLQNTFRSLRASGLLYDGIVLNDDFRLEGTAVDIEGSGWINLVKKLLDLRVKVHIAGISTIPVHMFGSLAEPQHSISGGGAIFATAKTAGGSLLSLVGNIVSLPFRAIGAVFSDSEKEQSAGPNLDKKSKKEADVVKDPVKAEPSTRAIEQKITKAKKLHKESTPQKKKRAKRSLQQKQVKKQKDSKSIDTTSTKNK